MIGTRHKARIIALQALYEIDCSAHPPDNVLSRLINEQDLSQETVDFIRELVQGVISNRDKIDTIIHKFAPAFPVEQLSIVDRNILRTAIFEILLCNEVPFKAVINEAVELAKHFSSNTSPKFINGVLGSIVSQTIGKEVVDLADNGKRAR